MKLFGLEISRAIEKKNLKSEDSVSSFSVPENTDGSTYINAAGATAGYYGHVLNLDGITASNEKDLILKYRSASTQPECDSAIAEITNAAIVSDTDGAPVNLILDKVDHLSESTKKKIQDEFDSILKLLNFNFNGSDLFTKWYIDGRLFYHLIVDPKKPKDGIKEMRMIDPLKMRKIKEVTTKIDKETGLKTVEVTSEYYIYSEDVGVNSTSIKVDPNSIVYVPSGLNDETRKTPISYLHKSIKLINQLRMMEDALVIYRISRAPERRIFYIDVGNLPKGKAEEYVQGIMSKYRNKLVYDATSGEIRDDRKSMSMLEDFWLPRREGGRGTEITTLPGGDNLGQIEDILFFQKKLYRSLNVPQSRLEQETMFNVGRASEISREEVKFQKFINRLRKRFSLLFIDSLRVQLLLKGIITQSDWADIRENINIDYVEDNFFSELKEFEIMRERLNMLNDIEGRIGKYYSNKWVRSNILNQSDNDIEIMDAEIAKERESEPDDSADDVSPDEDLGDDIEA